MNSITKKEIIVYILKNFNINWNFLILFKTIYLIIDIYIYVYGI